VEIRQPPAASPSDVDRAKPSFTNLRVQRVEQKTMTAAIPEVFALHLQQLRVARLFVFVGAMNDRSDGTMNLIPIPRAQPRAFGQQW